MTTELWRGLPFGGLGELGYALEFLMGAITFVMGCIGIFLCVLGTTRNCGTPLIEWQDSEASEDCPFGETAPSGGGSHVTIRLEPDSAGLFSGMRCVVTIRESLEDACEKAREFL